MDLVKNGLDLTHRPGLDKRTDIDFFRKDHIQDDRVVFWRTCHVPIISASKAISREMYSFLAIPNPTTSFPVKFQSNLLPCLRSGHFEDLPIKPCPRPFFLQISRMA